MENINDYIEEINSLEEKLCSLGKENNKYSNSIKRLKITKNIGIFLGTLLIPNLMYFIKLTDLTAVSNVFLMVMSTSMLGALSYGLVQSSTQFIGNAKEKKNNCEKDITETKQLLKEITIKHDNCLTNNLEKTNVTSYENSQSIEIENTSKKAKTYTKILKKDNE